MNTKIKEKTTYISREEKNGITQELLKNLFKYKNGKLYWKIKPNNYVKKGSKAGCIIFYKKKNEKRCILSINKAGYKATRIIYMWHHGYVPKIVDHIDRNPTNDKIENLREATPSQNCKNTTSRKGTSSKYLGVALFRNKLWRVQIRINGKVSHIGCFETEDEAGIAYNKAAREHYKEFASLNIIK